MIILPIFCFMLVDWPLWSPSNICVINKIINSITVGIVCTSDNNIWTCHTDTGRGGRNQATTSNIIRNIK